MDEGRGVFNARPVPPIAAPPPPTPDEVAHPRHYTDHPSGVECIQITEHLNFCLGNAMKYIWRAGLKGDANVDIRKAIWYLERELARRANEPECSRT